MLAILRLTVEFQINYAIVVYDSYAGAVSQNNFTPTIDIDLKKCRLTRPVHERLEELA